METEHYNRLSIRLSALSLIVSIVLPGASVFYTWYTHNSDTREIIDIRAQRLSGDYPFEGAGLFGVRMPSHATVTVRWKIDIINNSSFPVVITDKNLALQGDPVLANFMRGDVERGLKFQDERNAEMPIDIPTGKSVSLILFVATPMPYGLYNRIKKKHPDGSLTFKEAEQELRLAEVDFFGNPAAAPRKTFYPKHILEIYSSRGNPYRHLLAYYP